MNKDPLNHLERLLKDSLNTNDRSDNDNIDENDHGFLHGKLFGDRESVAQLLNDERKLKMMSQLYSVLFTHSSIDVRLTLHLD